MINLTNALSMSDHSSHTPGKSMLPFVPYYPISGFMTRHDRMLYICLIKIYRNGWKPLIPP